MQGKYLFFSVFFFGNLNFKLKIRIIRLEDLQSIRGAFVGTKFTFLTESTYLNVNCYCANEKS